MKRIEKPQEILRAQAEAGGEELPADALILGEAELKEKYPDRYKRFREALTKHFQNIASRENRDVADAWLHATRSFLLFLAREKKKVDELPSDEEILKEWSEQSINKLREKYQLPVFEKLFTHLLKGKTRGYVELPTGFGKTVVFSKLTEALNLKTLIVAPTKIILKQTVKALARQNVENVAAGAWAKGKEREDGTVIEQSTGNENVLVLSYADFQKKVNEGELDPNTFECVIFDEAHRILGPETAKAVAKIKKPIVLGFTATPNYNEGKGLNKMLREKVASMSVSEAMEKNMVASMRTVVLETGMDIGIMEVSEGGDFNQVELEQAVNTTKRNQLAVEVYTRVFKGKKSLVNCAGIKHAQDVSKLFNDAGIKAAWISGVGESMSKDEQENILKRYKAGEIQVLCGSDLLLEGFDDEEVSVCLNLKPTLSRIDATQRAGRTSRIDYALRDKIAHVVEFVDKGVPENYQPVLYPEILKSAQKFTPDFLKQPNPFLPDEKAFLPLRVITRPDVVQKLADDSRDFRRPPADWWSVADLGEEFNLPILARSITGKLAKEMPDDAWVYKHRDKKLKATLTLNYFSPDLKKALGDELEAIAAQVGASLPPKQWVECTERLSTAFEQKYSDRIGVYLSQDGKGKTKYWAKDMIAIAKREGEILRR